MSRERQRIILDNIAITTGIIIRSEDWLQVLYVISSTLCKL